MVADKSQGERGENGKLHLDVDGFIVLMRRLFLGLY